MGFKSVKNSDRVWKEHPPNPDPNGKKKGFTFKFVVQILKWCSTLKMATNFEKKKAQSILLQSPNPLVIPRP